MMIRKNEATVRRSDPLAPLAFLFFTAAGVAYIVVAKSLSLPSSIVTGVPVALMIVYALAIWSTRRLRLRDDQSGDNFYYMGFIYTLTSLGMSLYQYSSGSSVDDIVRNFGVAVASTITGIVLRIVFNQMRRDPMEFEHISRLELADTSRRVRRELEGVLYEMTHFRRTNQQMLDEVFDESRKQIEKVGSEVAQVAERMTQLSAATESVQAFQSQFETASQRMADFAAALDEATSSVSKSSRAIATKGRRGQPSGKPAAESEG
jgi:methyl-accepting chemotaxis protein